MCRGFLVLPQNLDSSLLSEKLGEQLLLLWGSQVRFQEAQWLINTHVCLLQSLETLLPFIS